MTCTGFIFDRGGNEPYYTRPMAADLPDLVDYARLGEEQAELERVYELAAMPRLRDLLAEPRGMLQANFAFAKAHSGRARVGVVSRGVPQLVPALHAGFIEENLIGHSIHGSSEK
jgi:hypothetical protein